MTFLSVGFEMKEVSGSSVWPGGETVALERLARHLERKVLFWDVFCVTFNATVYYVRGGERASTLWVYHCQCYYLVSGLGCEC